MVGTAPEAEVVVDEALVRALLGDQHPDLAELPLRPLANGWDNVLLRLGHERTLRMPRRAMSAPLVEHELRWLPELAPTLPLPVPTPERAGRPGHGYPWTWSIGPWFEGRPALEAPPDDPFATAAALGAFLSALHRPAPPGAPHNPYRGVPLGSRREGLHARAAVVGDLLDVERVLACWEELAAVEPWAGPPSWVHGDVHPRNLLVHDGVLAAVLDFGDLCAGDPATDLAVAWMLLPPEARPAFRAACGRGDLGPVDDASWRRGMGWALMIGVAVVATSAGDPPFARLGLDTVAAVLAEA